MTWDQALKWGERAENRRAKRAKPWDFISLFQIAPIDIYQLMILGRLEIHIALSNPANIDVRILPQGYCVAILSLSLLLT